MHFLEWNVWIPIKISLKFVPRGPINNIPSVVQIMACRRPGDKPLSEPMMISLTTHIYATRPQWVMGDCYQTSVCTYMPLVYLSGVITQLFMYITMTSLWRDGVSYHQPQQCLLNRLFRCISKKTSKLRVTGLCGGIHRWPVNSPHKWPVTRKMFPFDDVIMMCRRNNPNSRTWLDHTDSFNIISITKRNNTKR